MQKPQWGCFSLAKNSYCYSKDSFECLDSLKYLNLENFGNDNLHFAALLINGHNCRFIVDKLYEKIKVEFNGRNFTSLTDSDSIMNYIGNVLEKIEQNFFNEMSNLFKNKSDLLQTCNLKSEVEQSKILIEIDKIDDQLKSGATIAIAAVIKGRIYISNIGDNQIILVEKDRNNDDIDSKQFLLLTEEHNFHNEREINRIKEDCGLNPDALRWLSTLSQERCHSRCIGDFEMKTQYKQYEPLINAKSSPLICKPQIHKCIPFQDNFTHILMISSGLFYLVRELIYDTDKVPGEISRKFFELKSQYSAENLTQLCKRVIDCFVSDHQKCHDEYLRVMEKGSQVIEFSQHDDLSIFVIDISSYQSNSHVIKGDCDGFEVIEPNSDSFMFSSTTDSLNDFSSGKGDTYSSNRSGSNYSLTQITAYVDFSEWDKAMSKLTPEELVKIDLITNIDEPFALTIVEESESMLISRSTTVDDNKTSEISDFASMSPEICGLYSSSNIIN